MPHSPLSGFGSGSGWVRTGGAGPHPHPFVTPQAFESDTVLVIDRGKTGPQPATVIPSMIWLKVTLGRIALPADASPGL